MLTPSLALSTSATDGSPFRPSYIDELNSNRRRDVAGVLFDNIDRFVLFFSQYKIDCIYEFTEI